jgi:hypothetical protein
MRVIVCGSRTFRDSEDLEAFLTGRFTWICYGERISIDDLVIVCGGAQGADRLATAWARKYGADYEVYEADWNRHNMAAGPIRNRQMLDSGADMVVAFVDKPLVYSKGTLNMVTLARDAGVRTIVIEVTSPHGQRPDPTLFGKGHEEAEVL